MAKKRKSTDDQIKDENINESDDNFGLPEIEYEPLNREEEPVQEKTIYEETRTETTYTETTSSGPVEDQLPPPTEEEDLEAQERESYHNYSKRSESDDAGASSKVIGIVIVVVLLLAAIGGYYFKIYKPNQIAEQDRIRKEASARQEAEKLKDAARAAELKRQEDEQRRADSLANAKPSIGTIEQLEGRTGRYYVVVASAIDDDLILDYAKELSKKGVSSKVIPPFGKTKFSRIAISEADTYGDAQTIADGLKSEYGDGAWVVKY